MSITESGVRNFAALAAKCGSSPAETLVTAGKADHWTTSDAAAEHERSSHPWSAGLQTAPIQLAHYCLGSRDHRSRPVLAYVAARAGWLRRNERERLDRNTQAVRHVEELAEANSPRPDFGLRKDVPYGIIVPIVVVCLAVVLMIWSFHGTSMGTQQSSTTGSAPPRQSQQAVQAPVSPTNDAASDSARGGQEPLNKDR